MKNGIKMINQKRLNRLKRMQKMLILCLVLVLSQLAFGQFKVSERAQLVYNEHENQFFVLDDSSHYWTQKPGSKHWIKHSYVYLGDVPFLEMMNTTRVLAMSKNKYYFAHESCGTVYELSHDTLKRIDRSFPHRNQYGAPMFAWRGSVFMFGGYGFFQVKNVFTRYVPTAQEWFEVNTKSKELPSARSAPLFYVEKNKFYILGGMNRDHLNDGYLQDTWMYDLTSKKWQKLGELNKRLSQDLNQVNLNINLPNGVFRMSNKLIELNLGENKWSSYENPLALNMCKIVSSKKNKYLMYVLSNSNNRDLEVRVQNFQELKEMKIGEYQIFQKSSIFNQFPQEDYLWISLIMNFFLFSLLFYIRRIQKLKFLHRAQKKLIKSDFTKSEWEIMCMIYKHGEMELSALNEYFNEVGLSYETLKKRRETFVKNVRIKIALVTRKPIEEILVETKHSVDKRMKIIHWNDDIELDLDSE